MASKGGGLTPFFLRSSKERRSPQMSPHHILAGLYGQSTL
jgi:hypothetical protein